MTGPFRLPAHPRIAVIGAGAIGMVVATCLDQQGLDVTLVVRAASVPSLSQRGITVSGVRGERHCRLRLVDRLSEPPDLAILCVKTGDLASVLENHREVLANSIVVTTQNGVRADAIVAQGLPSARVVSSIVMFVATYQGEGTVVHNAEGSWILGDWAGSGNPSVAGTVAECLARAFPVEVAENVRPMKYTKTFLNANNCLAAILDRSLQTVFADLRLARIGVEIWREGYGVIRRLGIELGSLPGFPVERLTGLLELPSSRAAAILSSTMQGLSQYPVYGSILQSIQRGRPSEIDYINGEFARLAGEHGLSAKLNAKLTELVHRAESGMFLDPDALLAATAGDSDWLLSDEQPPRNGVELTIAT